MEGNTLINCRQPCGDPDCLNSCVYTREGNTSMDEIRDVVLQKLRKGESFLQIKQDLMEVINELKSMEVYIRAVQDADFAP